MTPSARDRDHAVYTPQSPASLVIPQQQVKSRQHTGAVYPPAAADCPGQLRRTAAWAFFFLSQVLSVVIIVKIWTATTRKIKLTLTRCCRLSWRAAQRSSLVLRAPLSVLWPRSAAASWACAMWPCVSRCSASSRCSSRSLCKQKLLLSNVQFITLYDYVSNISMPGSCSAG